MPCDGRGARLSGPWDSGSRSRYNLVDPGELSKVRGRLALGTPSNSGVENGQAGQGGGYCRGPRERGCKALKPQGGRQTHKDRTTPKDTLKVEWSYTSSFSVA